MSLPDLIRPLRKPRRVVGFFATGPSWATGLAAFGDDDRFSRRRDPIHRLEGTWP